MTKYNRDCILLIEGMRPIYDRKNRPFATEVWKEAEAATGEKGYVHPVRVIHDKEKDVYKTVDCEQKIIMVDKEEESFYRSAARTDSSIHFFDLDNEEFLYLNWNEASPPNQEELEKIVKESRKRDVSAWEEPDDVIQEETVEDQDHSFEMNLTGTVSDCLRRYAARFSEGKVNIILQSIEDGLEEEQIKRLFLIDNEKTMEMFRRIYVSARR